MDRNGAKKLLERLITEASTIAPSIARNAAGPVNDDNLDLRHSERWQIEAREVLRQLPHTYGAAFTHLYGLYLNDSQCIGLTVSGQIQLAAKWLVTARQLLDSEFATESPAQPMVKLGLTVPEKVTLAWLREHVEIKHWITLGAIALVLISSVFLAGYKLAAVKSFRDIVSAFGL